MYSNFRIITKNSAADPEIGLDVFVRAFLKEEEGCLEVGSNQCRPSLSSHGTNFKKFNLTPTLAGSDIVYAGGMAVS